MNVTEQEMLDIVKNAKNGRGGRHAGREKDGPRGLPDPRHAPAAGHENLPG